MGLTFSHRNTTTTSAVQVVVGGFYDTALGERAAGVLEEVGFEIRDAVAPDSDDMD